MGAKISSFNIPLRTFTYYALLRTSIALIVCSFALLCQAQNNLSWKGTVSSDWTNPDNWSPKLVPGEGDSIVIGTSTPNLAVLPSNTRVAALRLSGQTLNLNGFRLEVLHKSTFTSGTIQNGTLICKGATTNLGSSSPLILDLPVTIESSSGSIRNTTFNFDVVLVKSGSSGDYSYGGNTFKKSLTVTNNSKGTIGLANTSADIYMGDVIINANDSGSVQVAQNASGTIFQGDIYVSSNSGGQIRFCQGPGNATIVNGKTIKIGAAGFTTGSLSIKGFTQNSSTPTTLILGGTATLNIQKGGSWTGPFTATAPSIKIDSTNFESNVVLTKTGPGNDLWLGGNTFKKNLTLNQLGKGYITLANTYGDVFHDSLKVISQNSGIIYLSNKGANLMKGAVFIESTHGAGVRFGQSGGTTTVASSGKLIFGTYNSGGLYLKNLSIQSTSRLNIQSLDSAVIYLQGGTSFNGPVDIKGPNIRLEGSTFNQLALIEKTGSLAETGLGGNTFNGPATLIVSGSGSWTLASTNPDVAKMGLELRCNSTGMLNYASKAQNNSITGNLTFSGIGSGVQLGSSGGTTMLSGTAGSNAGQFRYGTINLRGITQTQSAVNSFNLDSSAKVQLLKGNYWTGPIEISAPGVRLDSNIFNAEVKLIKTGSSNDVCNGGNSFKSALSFENLGAGAFTFASIHGDTCAVLRLTSSSTGLVYFGNNSQSTLKDSIYLSSTGAGIKFNQGKGRLTLSGQSRFVVGTYTSGFLSLKGIVQHNPIHQKIALGGTATLQLQQGSTWKGDLEVAAPSVNLDSSTYNGAVDLVKTGDLNDNCTGGNTFNNLVSLRVTGQGNLMMGSKYPDVFRSYTVLSSENSGQLLMSHNSQHNRYEHDVVLKSQGGGIRFSQTSGSTDLLYDAIIDCSAFQKGHLYLKNVKQLERYPQDISVGDSAFLHLQAGNEWKGDFTSTCSTLSVDSNYFYADVYIHKTGKRADSWMGGNTFAGELRLDLDSGTILLGTTFPDRFIGPAYFKTLATAQLQLAYSSQGTRFGNRISLTGRGLSKFGQMGGSCELSEGADILISDYSAGSITFRNFNQKGSSPQSIAVDGTAIILMQQGTSWEALLSVKAPSIKIEGSHFYENTRLTKTGTAADISKGRNTFEKDLEVNIDAGASYLSLADSSIDYINGDLRLHSLGAGVRFGQTAGGVLLKGRILTDSLFKVGTLMLKGLSQSGSAQRIETHELAKLQIQKGTEFNDSVVLIGPAVSSEFATYHDNCRVVRYGSQNDIWVGGNIFNRDFSLANKGRGNVTLSYNFGDSFNGNATFRQDSSGSVLSCYKDTSYFKGHIEIFGRSGFSSAGGGGWLSIEGIGDQKIINHDPFNLYLKNLILNKPSGSLSFNDTVQVSGKLNMIKGVVRSDSTHLFAIGTFGTVSGASRYAYVEGLMQRIGPGIFEFPVGHNGIYHPLKVSGAITTGDRVNVAWYDYGEGSLGTPNQYIGGLKTCGYWQLDKAYGKELHLGFDWDSSEFCQVDDYKKLAAVLYTPSKIYNLGSSVLEGSNEKGTLQSKTGAMFSGFVFLGYKSFEFGDVNITNMVVSPNPVVGNPHIQFNFREVLNGKLLLHIYSANGQRIVYDELFVDEKNYVPYKLPALPPGIYAVKIQTNEQMLNASFIVD